MAGLGLLVASDELTDKDWTALSRAKGDGFMIAGATLYGFSTLSVPITNRHVDGPFIRSECDGRIFRPETSPIRSVP